MEDGPVRVSGESDLLGMREAAASLVGALVVTVDLRSGPILGISLAEGRTGDGASVDSHYRLWVYTGAWRVDDCDGIVVASQDPEDTVRDEIQVLRDKRFTDCEISFPALDTTLTFEEFRLRIFPDRYHSRDNAIFWTMRLPSGDLLFAGPGASWFVRKSGNGR